MAANKIVFVATPLALLIPLFLIAAHNVVAGQSTISTEDYTCTHNISSLQELQSMGNTGEGLNFTVCVNIPLGTHQINYTAAPMEYYRVVVRGNNATIRCTPNIVLSHSNYTVFPFIFKGSRIVSLENVHFQDCMRPVRFEEVLNVQLVNATFSNFCPAGAVEILNSPAVVIEGCRFTNNTSLGIGTAQYSGNAGAVAIGYNNLSSPEDSLRPCIQVSNSVFVDNSAAVIEGFSRSTSEVLASRIYNQRGGATAFYFGTDNYSAEVLIDHCDFEGNVAASAGGGVYMYLTGENNAHTVTITKTNFTRNQAADGGGLEITFDTSDSIVNPSQIYIADCNFLRNIGTFGGGFKSIQLNSQGNQNYVTVVNSEFTENVAPVGSGIYFQSRFTIVKVVMKTRIMLQDCKFFRNDARRGALFVTRNTVQLQGTILFIGNVGPSIRVVNSLLSIRDGDIWFTNNRRHEEGFSGQLYLSSFGQLLLHRNSNLTFINNTGSEGACIVVKGQSITSEFSHQLYNPQCFMVYENATTPPPEWEVTMKFVRNGAAVGPVIFIPNLEACEWYSRESPYFADNDPNTVWSFMEMRDNYIIRGREQLNLSDYSIQTQIHQLQLGNSTITSAPGDPIVVDALALDELGHNTSAFLKIAAPMNDNSSVFQPGIVQTQAGVGKINFTYFSQIRTGNSTVLLNTPFTALRLPPSQLTLVHEDCLPGYSFSSEENQCVCAESDLKEIILCQSNRQGILLANGLWGAPPNWSRTLVTVKCPSGYCHCTGGTTAAEGSSGCLLVYNDPFSFCQENRTGILCGKCRDDYGVGLLTTKCRPYTGNVPEYYWLIPIYVVLVIPVLIVIVKLGIKFPTVLKGFLLYIQLAPTAVAFLPQSFDLRPDVMDCIESILGFYFPYDFNFHQGLTALEAYGLKYIALLFAVTVVPIAMRIRYRSKNWHGVWTIVLLMYVMTTETSVSLLFCHTLNRTVNGERITTTIWFFDGNVECYQGVHLLLTIISVIVLILLGMLIPLTALAIYQDKISYKFPIFDRLERCSQALTRGIKPQFKWWPIEQLVIRYIFVIAVILSPGLITLPLVLSLRTFILQTFVHPYEDWKANYTESLVMLTLVILLALGNTSPLVARTRNMEQFTLWPLLYLPVIVGAGYVLILIAYTAWKWFSTHKDDIKRCFSEKENSSDNDRHFTLSLSGLHRAWNVRHRGVTTTSISFSRSEVDEEEDSDSERQSMTYTDSRSITTSDM